MRERQLERERKAERERERLRGGGRELEIADIGESTTPTE